MGYEEADFGVLLRRAGEACGDDEARWALLIERLPGPVLRRLVREFFWQAHGGQGEPAACADGSEWRVWMLMAGRGFGKTRAGAEWVSARAREVAGARIALVGASSAEVARVMIEGPSGLLAVAQAAGEQVGWVPTRGALRFASGAEAFVYSGAAGDQLRGPQHHFAWCDEIAKWRQADLAWDNLMMGMRLGPLPRVVVTTTPRSVAIVRRVEGLAGTVRTGGATGENVHVSEAFRQWVVQTYGGTRLGRQEIEGVLFEEVEGALFPRELLERARKGPPPAPPGSPGGEWQRVVVGVDPPASAGGDACGIVVCGLGSDGVAYVLADCSVAGLRPEGWARAVAGAADAWAADRVVAEKNQGGDMVEDVLRGADSALPVRLVSASRGKSARAEPVASWMEAGRVRLAGAFPELEDELAGLQAGGGYEGPGRSPDRADACVWALTELIRPQREPRVAAL